MADPAIYRSVMVKWNAVAMRAGLTQQQTAILAAQFTGLTIATANPQLHTPQLEVATRAMNTACVSKTLGVDQETYFHETKRPL